MNEWMIQTNLLTKKLGKTVAVQDVNLKIKKGEIYGFLGPNGAGKTTTIKMLLGLMKPTLGSIHMFGQNLRQHQRSILRRVGSLVEYPSYYGHLTAYENLEAVRRIIQVPKSRIDEVLSIVRLTNEAKRPVKGFSLGMKQRLGIATALLGQPELLILDEPTNGLDPSGIHEIRELIKKMPREQGITVLVSSHLLSEIDLMATEVGVIAKGRMIFQDSIEQLRKQAQSEVHLITNDSKQAMRSLLSRGIQTGFAGDGFKLHVNTDQEVAEVVRYLVQQDFSIYRVMEHKKSLEDIFLDLVRGEESL